ncbi:hypothetical protein KSF_049160 [Reticulibacter mediterranei]|uniref:Uncharacterized protein n=1 Tax=Reticulibacter mediterranei TaxID=2778369 RepID=A0A8J3N3X4_9CHLR|nr:hypothetical protein [Reticulibacter mediterranei]GHO94868.1 hypothetical protein KSF_049160 [Reticulibacter mediterranei]
MLRWCFEEEHAYQLTRPEIAHDVIQITTELADLLGITLGEVAPKGSSCLQ